jgi:hypothetical protein
MCRLECTCTKDHPVCLHACCLLSSSERKEYQKLAKMLQEFRFADPECATYTNGSHAGGCHDRKAKKDPGRECLHAMCALYALMSCKPQFFLLVRIGMEMNGLCAFPRVPESIFWYAVVPSVCHRLHSFGIRGWFFFNIAFATWWVEIHTLFQTARPNCRMDISVFGIDCTLCILSSRWQ